MPQRDQKTHEERDYRGSKPAQEQNDDYDVYLFWPSLSCRDVSSGDPPSSPLYGPVSSLHSESTEFDFSGISSGPPSPIMFAPTPDCRFQMGLDFGKASPDVPEAEAKVPKSSEPGKYSAIFKLGLFLSQMTHRAFDGVKTTFCKSKSQTP